ncbi:MAG: hypothetical protein Kow00114_36420 [Kiloniellaceae bacterium]
MPRHTIEVNRQRPTPPAEAKALLKPYAGAMIAYPVDKAVGSPKNDGPAPADCQVITVSEQHWEPPTPSPSPPSDRTSASN